MTSAASPLVRLLALLAALALPAVVAAQATSPDAAQTAASATSSASGDDASSDDPWEPFNRVMFDFNEGLDRWVVKPAAVGWDTVLPRPVQVSIDNFFDNLKFPARFVNDLLQGELDPAAITLCRFAVNTRSLLLDEVDAAREASFDFYIAVRTAYFERRQRLIKGLSETERGGNDDLYFPDYSDQEVLP